MCLEEMLCCSIEYGYLFWGAKHRREKIVFSADLRNIVDEAFQEMHQEYTRGYTPKVKLHKKCGNCSLKEICLPEMTKLQSVSSYISSVLGDLE